MLVNANVRIRAERVWTWIAFKILQSESEWAARADAMTQICQVIVPAWTIGKQGVEEDIQIDIARIPVSIRVGKLPNSWRSV